MPDQPQPGVPGQSGQDAPGTPDVIQLRTPRRPAAVMPVPARNGLPEPRYYRYGGTGYDQLAEDEQ